MMEEAQRRAKLVMDSKGYGTPLWASRAARAREQASDPELWTDPSRAQEVVQRLRGIEAIERRAQRFESAAEEMSMALELALEEETYLEDAKRTYDSWIEEIAQMELEVLLGGKYDSYGCQMNIFAGAGGEEACDWVIMLERMYVNFCESKGWKVKRVDCTPGDTNGMKSVELEIEGEYVFGFLKGEEGTHRLVRMWNGKRQTTFAGIEVIPIIPEDNLDQVEIRDCDLVWATFRSGGKGGQNVNKVETGVRVEHVPSGIKVECREERSQGANRTRVLQKLKQRLVAAQEKLKADEISAIRGDQVAAAWGAQVRNYVLQPYQLVKDVRSGHERGDALRVLDGDLGSHIDAYLRSTVSS